MRTLDRVPFDATSSRVGIRRPVAGDADELIALNQLSRDFHYPWVDPPKSRETFDKYLLSRQAPDNDGFVFCLKETGRIIGVINVNCIVRGHFHSAYLGYYIGSNHARQEYMTEALNLVTRYAFEEMKLHRLESNIQPGNAASIALVRKCGFHKEGFSPGYLEVFGQWRDHERWALLVDGGSY